MSALFITATFLFGAEFLDQTFDKAAEAYENHAYPAAIDQYEQLVAEGVVNPAVFYNLGNAYYRQGLLAPAIANYERALQLDPGMQNAQYNLEQCLRQTEMRMERPLPPVWERSLLFWHYGLARHVTSTVALAAWFLFWLLLAARQFRPIPYLRLAASVVLVIAIAFGLSAWDKAHPTPLAVAARPVVPVYYGTSVDEVVRFELHEGDRVTIDRREGGWARVVTADGEKGWTENEALVFVGPPYERPAATQTETASKEPLDDA